MKLVSSGNGFKRGKSIFYFFGKGTFFLNYVLLTYDSHSIKYPTMQIPVGLSVLRGSHDPHHHCALAQFRHKEKAHRPKRSSSMPPAQLLRTTMQVISVISPSLASLHAQSVKACGTYLLKGSLQGRTLAPAFVCLLQETETKKGGPSQISIAIEAHLGSSYETFTGSFHLKDKLCWAVPSVWNLLGSGGHAHFQTPKLRSTSGLFL